jgi:hypothetical protein
MAKISMVRTSKMFSFAQLVAIKPIQMRMAQYAAESCLFTSGLNGDAENCCCDKRTDECGCVLKAGRDGCGRCTYQPLFGTAYAFEPLVHEDCKPECFKEKRDDCGDEDSEPIESYVFHEASATGSRDGGRICAEDASDKEIYGPRVCVILSTVVGNWIFACWSRYRWRLSLLANACRRELSKRDASEKRLFECVSQGYHGIHKSCK